MDFKTWMRQVNAVINRAVGCSVYDLEDWCWRDAYDDGYTPEEAAEEALDEMGLHIPDLLDYSTHTETEPGL